MRLALTWPHPTDSQNAEPISPVGRHAIETEGVLGHTPTIGASRGAGNIARRGVNPFDALDDARKSRDAEATLPRVVCSEAGNSCGNRRGPGLNCQRTDGAKCDFRSRFSRARGEVAAGSAILLP